MRRWLAMGWVVVSVLAGTTGRAERTDPDAAEWMERARSAEARGLIKQAIEFATRAVEMDASDPRSWLLRSQLFQRIRQWGEAEIDLGRVIELRPNEPAPYYERGNVRLRRSDYPGSVHDFDRLIELRPARAASLWQRGIALFYAGRPDDARKQFELHRSVNPADVENSAWHFACIARVEGAAAARAQWMPVEGDRRIPMAEIQALMAGTGTVESVVAAAKAVQDAGRRTAAVFYADLYLAMFYDAEGRRDLAARHAAAAAAVADAMDIMGDIARCHVQWLARQMAGTGK